MIRYHLGRLWCEWVSYAPDTARETTSAIANSLATVDQLAFSEPCFQGGQRDSLDELIAFTHNCRQAENPNVPGNALDDDFCDLPNIKGQRTNLMEQFLNALKDNQFDRTRHASVPGDWSVGGTGD